MCSNFILKLMQGVIMAEDLHMNTSCGDSKGSIAHSGMEVEPQLASIVKRTNELVALASMDHTITFLNDAGCEMLGIDSTNMCSCKTCDFIPDHLKDISQDIFQKVKNLGSWQGEFQFRNLKTGRVIDVLWTMFFIADPRRHEPGYFASIALDITIRKREEKSHRLNLLRTQVLLQINQMGGASIKEITDFALEKSVELTQSEIGYLAFLNEDETILTMHSWSKTAMKNCVISEKPIHYPVGSTGLWGEAVRQRKPVITNDYSLPNSLKKGFPEGHVQILRHMNAPVFVENKIVLVAGVANKKDEYDESDIDQLTLLMQGMWRLIEHKRSLEEKEKLQAQLHQAQKMESIGRLAGGVAHDFNNMLGAILGFTEMSIDTITPDKPLYDVLQEIRNAALRSAELTRQLLAFARKQPIAPKALDLNDTVEMMFKMLRRLIGEDITLVWQPGKNLHPIMIDPSQVDQILANLCINARDAIDGAGKISIKTEHVTFDETYCMNHTGVAVGDYVSLELSDTGCGMSPETLSQLFEPFFTTKELGKGTGLGLATVYGIVQQNNGLINVYSEPGIGTTFTIYFPVHKSEPVTQPPEESLNSLLGSDDQTILLVEDEAILLKMTQQILERLNYKVLAAPTPREALKIAQTYKGKINLLLTDVIMPVMNGKDLAERITAFLPDIQCLFMSGYAGDLIIHQGVLDKEMNFIQKPFSQKELAKNVKKILESCNAGKTVFR
jgi:PAS domain S-box-containing protein